MMHWLRRPVSVAALVAAAFALAGCSFGPQIQTSSIGAEQLTPVQDSTVATGTLPPIGAPGEPAPSLSGQPVLGGQTAATTQVADTAALPAPDPFGNPTAGGRDLSGGLTIEKLLGGWTIASGATTCQLNLTYTAKTGTSRYRASTPGCQITGLGTVGSWQLAGSQVQLFDEAGTMVAALVLSGDRFIGTSAGGGAITMSA
jgi:Protease inhibitor Inh